jgi:hypothetical protein
MGGNGKEEATSVRKNKGLLLCALREDGTLILNKAREKNQFCV